MIGKYSALGCQFVNIGRVHVFFTITTQFRTQIIHRNEQYIHLLGNWLFFPLKRRDENARSQKINAAYLIYIEKCFITRQVPNIGKIKMLILFIHAFTEIMTLLKYSLQINKGSVQHT